MKKLIAAAGFAALVAAVPSVGMAQDKKEASPHTFTGNLNLVSEYRYRGISQTNNKPAVQGGFDYAHASGVYVGTWLTNVSWLSDGGAGTVSNSLEWDIYGGYKGAVGDFGYDVGLLYYYYPGKYPAGFNSPDTLEAYIAGSYKTVTLKYSHAMTDLFGFIDSKGAGYLDLTATYDLGNGFGLVGHYGYQMVPSTNGRARSDCSYGDWKVGVTTEVVGMTVGLSYIGTDAKGDAGQCYRNAFNRDLGKGNVVLSVGKTF
jgi:uncharacterized protein (TIGR02001 family)